MKIKQEVAAAAAEAAAQRCSLDKQQLKPEARTPERETTKMRKPLSDA